MAWYRQEARALPWRATRDPYRIWVSEIMLQQTRAAAVVEHYTRFLDQFPTLVSLSLAREEEVLAAWSGLGYYRRARLLHKAAQFVVLERAGVLPSTAVELRTLPGIGGYTAAAIASIAFGESVAVVDGNVERVVLRLTGRGEDGEMPIRGAATQSFVRGQAQGLIPASRIVDGAAKPERPPAPTKRKSRGAWSASERTVLAAAANPDLQADEGMFHALPEGDSDPGAAGAEHVSRMARPNAAGDHNQAMMELGATICLPRAPLCSRCPVKAFCRTRGEHRTAERPRQLSQRTACLLRVRRRGTTSEVLLERRAATASLMPGMYELPLLPVEAVAGHEPVLRVRHAITNTNYYVEVYSVEDGSSAAMRTQLPRVEEAPRDLAWFPARLLTSIPLTGLARKILRRLKVMEGSAIELLR